REGHDRMDVSPQRGAILARQTCNAVPALDRRSRSTVGDIVRDNRVRAADCRAEARVPPFLETYSARCICRATLVEDDSSCHHHPADIGQPRDLISRVARQSDDVGEETGRYLAAQLRFPEMGCRRCRQSLENGLPLNGGPQQTKFSAGVKNISKAGIGSE